MSARAFAGAVLAATLLACAWPVPPPHRTTTVRADDPLVGRIYDVAAREFIPYTQVGARASRADFVLLGEKHDNPDHHRLQAWVLEELARHGRAPAVAFEMVRVDRAEALARAPRDADAIALALDWSHSGWPDFALYRPVFEAALANDMPLAAADLPADRLAPLRKEGLAAFTAEERERLALEPGPDPAERERLAAQVRDAHCGMVPDAIVPRMIDIQRARDSALADALVNAATVHGAVLIAGAGHASAQAVPLYLSRRATQRVVFALAFLEAPREPAEGSLEERAAALGEGFDVIWITPRVDDEDPCSRFRQDLEQIRRPGANGSRTGARTRE
jgi:uncharacterized iron-regulated protein